MYTDRSQEEELKEYIQYMCLGIVAAKCWAPTVALYSQLHPMQSEGQRWI